VLVTKVVKEDVPIFAEAIATLNGSTNTQINAQVSGYLIKQAYIEGQYVKKGDLLFQIDPKPFQAALAQAQANLVTAQAQLKKSQEDLTRYKALVQSGAVSQQEYQNEVQVVNGAQGNVDASAAAVTTAQINLGYATINAPIDGIAGKANPNVGDLIQPNTVMTTMSTVDPIQVQFTVSESFYMQNQARINQISDMPMANRPYGLQMIMPNGSVYPHKGQFYYLDRQVNNNTGTFNVYALFPNPERILRPGQFVRVRGVAEQINGAIVIPQRAIAELQGLNQVYVVQDDNTINVVNVQVGDTHGSLQVITSGLTEGQTIVVEGIQKCQQGTKVDPKPWQEPKAADIAPNTNAPPTAPATNTLVEPAKP
jgi:membrane fusion protein (multidrug efflux system)